MDVDSTTSEVIVTCHEAFEACAALQCNELGLSASRIAPGLLRCEGKEAFNVLFHAAGTQRSIFVRHLLPIQVHQPVQDTVEATSRSVVDSLGLGAIAAFSVQVRTFGTEFGRGELAIAFEALAVEWGSSIERRHPEKVLSIVVRGRDLFAGLATPASLLSSWSGGEVRYRLESSQISRAEGKLLEAIEIFSIPVGHGADVLDLGAAPGGWSKVLSQAGCRVTAIDPAALDPRCGADGAITHYRMTSQEFMTSHPNRSYQLIVNDMKMDACESAKIMNEVRPMLVDGGACIMTLKLPHTAPKRVLEEITASLSILREAYVIRGIRQLFHNRSEVTVLLG
jgi:23S rRNA (cytidine2498-2'-O)-methyltransferase